MTKRTCLAVVLAAGEGTRMRSMCPKVLHEIGGRAMAGHVIGAASAAGADKLAVIVGPNMEDVAGKLGGAAERCRYFVQAERRGTGHAVLAARDALAEGADDVLVLFGDTPLIRSETLTRVRRRLADGADLVVLGFEPDDPTGYGRLLVAGGELTAIREERDASIEERAVRLCNSGIMGFNGSLLPELLQAIGNDNSKKEYYLTDAVEIARGRGLTVVAERGDADEVLGVNDRAQLAACEEKFQARARKAALAAGVTLVAPDTVHFAHDTELAGDVVVEPNVVFAAGVKVGGGARIRAFSHLEGADVGPGAIVGPYARLRPGTRIANAARVGNFVEIKNATLDEGAKVNHLTYIGDAHIGAGANIGAGTITCNYDGYGKFRTEIGEGAFIGSNSALVAPVTVGARSYVGTGSVVTDDVPDDSLAIARQRQVTKPGRAAELRAQKAAKKRKPD